MSDFLASPGFMLFNALVLELQRLAQEQPLQRFHDQMLERSGELLPFAKAWWGRAALIDGLPHEHSSHVYGLPASYVQDWQSIRDQDITVQRVHAHPGHAVIVDSQAADAPRRPALARRPPWFRAVPVHHPYRPANPLERTPDALSRPRRPPPSATPNAACSNT